MAVNSVRMRWGCLWACVWLGPEHHSLLAGHFPLLGSHHPPIPCASATKTPVAGVLPLQLWCWQRFSPWPDPNSGSPEIFKLDLDSWTSVFVSFLSSFSRNDAKMVWPEPCIFHIWSSGSSFSAPSQVMSDHPGLPPARILLGHFSQNLFLPLMLLLSNFPSTDPLFSLATNSYWAHPVLRAGSNLLHCETPYTHQDGTPGIKSPFAPLTNVTGNCFFNNAGCLHRSCECLAFTPPTTTGLFIARDQPRGPEFSTFISIPIFSLQYSGLRCQWNRIWRKIKYFLLCGITLRQFPNSQKFSTKSNISELA